jgi:N-acetylneuraminate synthase
MIAIAEVGLNHQGELDIAKRLMLEARNAGADYVKFQKRNPDVSVPQEMRNEPKHTPWGEMTYIEYKRRMEFSKEQYDEIDMYSRLIGIPWFASVWDTDSLNFIMQYNVPYIKIPSAKITDNSLLLATLNTGKPVMIGLGMSTIEEVDNALKVLKTAESLTVLHSKSIYPTPEDCLDLAVIPALKHLLRHRRITVGYSGHEAGIWPSICAASMGADVIERHITLDREAWGTDHKASITPEEFKALVQMTKRAKSWRGAEYLRVYPQEIENRKKLR